MAYYNEFDSGATSWLNGLRNCNLIAQGEVDSRNIQEVELVDLKDRRCHFFAGIGGWDLALRLAGFPEDYPVWTGSCPCQPFSQAGQKKGTADSRHVWPEFARLIDAGRPPIIFGEQVASPDGRRWFEGVHADLSAMGYRTRAMDICAAAVGAPHVRQRLYFGAVRGDLELRLDERMLQRSWSDFVLIPCGDEKIRRIHPDIYPLAPKKNRLDKNTQINLDYANNTSEGRVLRLRGYGNAIVPQVAATFIRTFVAAMSSGGSSSKMLRGRVLFAPEYTYKWKNWELEGFTIPAIRATSQRKKVVQGWTTPTSRDHSRGNLPPRPHDTGVQLSQQAVLAGWPTPTASNADRSGYKNKEAFMQRVKKGCQLNLESVASMSSLVMAGWLTPKCPSGGGKTERNTSGGGLRKLEDQALLATGKKFGGLNPALSRWLMGYPAEWCMAAIKENR